MPIFNTLYTVVTSAYAVIGLLHLQIFLRRRELRLHLIFAIMALCSAVATYLDLQMHTSQTVDQFTRWLKMTNNVQGVLWICFVWFIDRYTAGGRRWLAWSVTLLYVAAITVNEFSAFGILFHSIDQLVPIPLFWGEHIQGATGPANPLRLLADIAWLLMLAYALDSTIRMGRRGQRRRALFFGTSIFACLGVGYLYGTLVDLGMLPAPSIWSLTFMALILLMSDSLAGDVVKTSILSEETTLQEQRWRSLLDNVKMLVMGLTPDGKIDYANAHFFDTIGFGAEEVIGRPVTDIIPVDEQAEFRRRLSSAISGQGFIPIAYRSLNTKHNGRRKIRWANVRLHDARGRIDGILSIGEDVTDILAAEKALADEKERMGLILSSLETGLALMDTDLSVLWVNETIRRSLPFGDPLGQKCYRFAENRDTPCDGCGALAALADGQTRETVRFNEKADKWYQIISIPVRDEEGRIVHVLEATTDITARKLAEIDRDHALAALHALKVQLEAENLYLKTELSGSVGDTEIIGESNAIRYIHERVRQVAETDATVLIQGETGVGKELVARAVYQASQRAGKPYIRVNCAALTPALVESELFGHVAGAFTGADRSKKGRFELADQGTLLLDEISELTPEVQAKLLRVLQEGQFERVGGTETLHVDVRVIATTNRDLQQAIADGAFRADLYYRLQVYPITVPPLRKRREDIEPLVMHFLAEINTRVGKEVHQIPRPVMERLIAYNYPGNVRELKNLLENAVITSRDRVLRLPLRFSENGASKPNLNQDADPGLQSPPDRLESLDEAQRKHIQRVLDHTGGRIEGADGAAAILEIKPSTLRHRMQKLGIRKSKTSTS